MKRNLIPVFLSAILAVSLGAIGCSNEGTKTEKTTSTTVEGPKGSTETKTKEETKQVGETTESKVETKVDSPDGSRKLTAETIVGTVTSYTAGKKIEVMTGEKKTHSFDLDDKNVIVSVDNGIQVGTKVRLVEEKDSESKPKRISVVVES